MLDFQIIDFQIIKERTRTKINLSNPNKHNVITGCYKNSYVIRILLFLKGSIIESQYFEKDLLLSFF
jgi:hypothetical protein